MNNLMNKIKLTFEKELGYSPKVIIIDNEICYADGFWCMILNNKTIKRTHGLCWRIDTND